ncbi:hypothetical protein U0E23_33200, partial [Burkholderia stagnalis]|uniref:hypothetical protein n=1 Tax=Burkholderia stagnalis TaxID=1503054 RepID=UPI002AB591DD
GDGKRVVWGGGGETGMAGSWRGGVAENGRRRSARNDPPTQFARLVESANSWGYSARARCNELAARLQASLLSKIDESVSEANKPR